MDNIFSPAEWQYHKEEKHIYVKCSNPSLNDVCVLYRPKAATSSQIREIEANAALIAQAPVMYEALLLTIEFLQHQELKTVIKQILNDATK